MLGKRRVAILMAVLGLFLIAFAAVMSTWVGSDSEQGKTLVMWVLSSDSVDMTEFFSKLIVLGLSTGVALFGTSLLLVAAMTYFRSDLGVEDDWSDWSE